MRLVVASALVALALPTAPAHAQETECLFGPNIVRTDGTGREHCEFEAQDLPAHGYVALTPNGFRVYVDRNDNDRFDRRDDELIFTRPFEGNVSVVGPLTLATGTVYDVDLYDDCTPDASLPPVDVPDDAPDEIEEPLEELIEAIVAGLEDELPICGWAGMLLVA